MAVIAEFDQRLIGSVVPEPHRLVGAAAHQGLPIGAKGQGGDGVPMPLKFVQQAARAAIPEQDVAIFTSTGNNLAGGVHGHRPNPATMSL